MEYTLKLDENDMIILNTALIELPFKTVAPLIDKINKQISNNDKTDT